MIDSLKGILTKKEPTSVVINVGGVFFKLIVPVSSYSALPQPGSDVEILTYLHVKEDGMELYGFSSEGERESFLLLYSVNGIGPKTAIGILSRLNPNDLKKRVVDGDVNALTTVPGIGPKTAKRLIVELRDKFIKGAENEIPGVTASITTEYSEVISALISLGYTSREAYQKLTVLKNKNELSGSVEEIVRRALTVK